METRRAVIPLAFVAILSTALFHAPFSGGEITEASPSRMSSSQRSSAGPVALPRVSDDEDSSEVLDVLADSYGIDTSSEGLERMARRSARVLQSTSQRRSQEERRRATGFLSDFFDLRIRKTAPRLLAARNAIKRLFNSQNPGPGDDAAMVQRFMELYFDEDALRIEHPDPKSKLLAEDFSRINKTPLKFGVVWREAEAHKSHVRYLIATLPDPIDSYTGWQFDPMLDAIVQAISASDYVLDRFHFPDSDRAKDEGALAGVRRRHAHDEEASVIVFRKQDNQQPSNDLGSAQSLPVQTWPDRLVLLVVHENPTAGIHPRALASAITDVSRWPSCDPSVLILGPTFSGSSDSMARALELARRRRLIPNRSIRIISGSATDPRNKTTLESATDDVVFHATVNKDSVLIPTLMEQFTKLNWSTPIAVLHEANTQYGSQTFEIMKTDRSAKDDRGRDVLIELPFPMNLSRLRKTAERNGSGDENPFGLPMGLRPLPMEESENPRDKIPQFFPNTASAYIEIGIARMLQTLQQEHVKSVAIMATDPRDKLYLAQQIARYSPDVSLLTAESDSLYIHPDYSTYLKGALVASTYPLYSGNQRWSYGFTGGLARREFANGSAQGIYNATLALLDYKPGNRRGDRYAPAIPNDASVPALLEYGFPEEPCANQRCSPPVWISVIGRKSALPMRAIRADAGDAEISKTGPYIFEVSVPTPQGPLATSAPPATFTPPATFPSPLLSAAFILSTVAIGWYWIFAHRVRRDYLAYLFRGGHRRQLAEFMRDDTAPGRGNFLVAIAGVIVVETFVGTICVARLRVDWSTWSFTALVAVSICLVALIELSFPVVIRFIRHDLRGPRGTASLTSASTWGGFALTAVCSWSLWSLLRYEWSIVNVGPDTSAAAMELKSAAIGFVARAVDSGSGVCPTLPVVFLSTVVVLWGVIELSRLRSRGVALANDNVHSLVRQTINGNLQPLAERWKYFDRSILAVPNGLTVVAALAAVATCVFAFDPLERPLMTSEGPWFGQYVSAMLLLAQVMLSLSLLQLVFLWVSLKGLLERMAWHSLAAVYERVPRELFPKGLFLRMPRLMELQKLVACWDKLPTPSAGIQLGPTFQQDMNESPTPTWSTTRSWPAVLQNAVATLPAAEPDVKAVMPIEVRDYVMMSGSVVAPSARLVEALEPDGRHDDFLAMSMALVIRDALARLSYNLVFVIGGVLLVFGSHSLFPFQAHQRLAALGWIYIGLTFGSIVVVLVQMKRNETIARLSVTAGAQQSTWDGEFVSKLIAFGLLPLLTLFAAQFPGLGGWLLHWLQPVEKALP